MNKEQLESMMIDYVDGLLDETDREKMEALIASDPGVHMLYEQTKTILHFRWKYHRNF